MRDFTMSEIINGYRYIKMEGAGIKIKVPYKTHEGAVMTGLFSSKVIYSSVIDEDKLYLLTQNAIMRLSEKVEHKTPKPQTYIETALWAEQESAD